MKIQRKLLSLLGIASIIGGGSTLPILATSCGKEGPFVPAFSLFDNVSVTTKSEAKKAMKTVTWIWKHGSEYGYSDYELYSNDAPYDGIKLSANAFKDSSFYRFGGNEDYVNSARYDMTNQYAIDGIALVPVEVSIWCELVYDMSWQYCNSKNFKISNFELQGFQFPALWCNVDGQGIGGTAYIHTVYKSGVDSSGIVLDNFGEPMNTKYVNGFFSDMDLSDEAEEHIYNKFFTCSWGSTAVFDYFSVTPNTYTIHTQKLFGIGETGHMDYDSTTGIIILYDEPTLYWFNTSFILQNCI